MWMPEMTRLFSYMAGRSSIDGSQSRGRRGSLTEASYMAAVDIHTTIAAWPHPNPPHHLHRRKPWEWPRRMTVASYMAAKDPSPNGRGLRADLPTPPYVRRARISVTAKYRNARSNVTSLTPFRNGDRKSDV